MSLQKSLNDAVVNHFNPAPRYRAAGFHASQAGKCPRNVLLTVAFPHMIKPKSEETMGTFAAGHLIDKWVKQAIEDGVYDADGLLNVTPKRLHTSIGDLTIHGEPDVILIDTKNKVVNIIDIKSAKDSAFAMVVKDGVKRGNAMQVSTYCMADEWHDLAVKQDYRIVGWVMYIHKDNFERKILKVDPRFLGETLQYWKDIEFLAQTNQVPDVGSASMLTPQEMWECGYCDLFEPFVANSTTKTTIRAERAQYRTACYNACQLLHENKEPSDG